MFKCLVVIFDEKNVYIIILIFDIFENRIDSQIEREKIQKYNCVKKIMIIKLILVMPPSHHCLCTA